MPSIPHRRRNALTGEWILVSPQRMARPWRGQVEPTAAPRPPRYDPACPLCPGNRRASGAVNPVYTGTYAFENDFSALLPGAEDGVPETTSELLRAESEPGTCRVLCFSPRHDLTLAEMSHAERRAVVDLWVEETRALGARPGINAVQIFENRGAMMGCSDPHPHGQVWAQSTVPGLPAREGRRLTEHHAAHGRTLLEDYMAIERADGERLVLENETFSVVVPFWAAWPFETLVVPRRRVALLTGLSAEERDGLADALGRLTACYDALFATSFPYSAGVHQAPTDGQAHPEWHLHMHFLPPLLRSATVRKFMVGYEMLAEPQRDLTPEAAAARLRDAVSAAAARAEDAGAASSRAGAAGAPDLQDDSSPYPGDRP